MVKQSPLQPGVPRWSVRACGPPWQGGAAGRPGGASQDVLAALGGFSAQVFVPE